MNMNFLIRTWLAPLRFLLGRNIIWKVARKIKNFPPARAWKEGTKEGRWKTFYIVFCSSYITRVHTCYHTQLATNFSRLKTKNRDITREREREDVVSNSNAISSPPSTRFEMGEIIYRPPNSDRRESLVEDLCKTGAPVFPREID